MCSFLRRLYEKIRINRLATIALVLTAAEMIIHFVPVFFHGGSTIHTGVSKDDALDLITPIVLIPLVWTFFVGVARDRPTGIQVVLFLVASAVWVEGHGMHLAVDSIANMIGEDTNTPGGSLIYFYDEVLGHYLLQVGTITLSALILWRGWFSKNPIPMGNPIPFLVSGLWYGWLFFAFSVEGQTVLMAMPVATLALGACFWRWRVAKSIGAAGIVFALGYALALFLLIGWGILHGGFPEFTSIET